MPFSLSDFSHKYKVTKCTKCGGFANLKSSTKLLFDSNGKSIESLQHICYTVYMHMAKELKDGCIHKLHICIIVYTVLIYINIYSLFLLCIIIYMAINLLSVL